MVDRERFCGFFQYILALSGYPVTLYTLFILRLFYFWRCIYTLYIYTVDELLLFVALFKVLYVNEDYEEALKNYTQAISLQDVCRG